MPETMLKRIALTVLPEMHHGITGATESPEAAARRLARKILIAMRDPTSFMVEAGEDATRDTHANMAGAEASYTAMIDAALGEETEELERDRSGASDRL